MPPDRLPKRWRSTRGARSCACAGCASAAASRSACRRPTCAATASTASPPPTVGDRSLYTLLRERYGIHPALAEEVYRVAGAGRRDAELLGIDPGAAVFLVERITSDERGPFEYTLSTMRGDRYEIRSSLRAT